MVVLGGDKSGKKTAPLLRSVQITGFDLRHDHGAVEVLDSAES
jgi:hypothetical protein